MRLIAVLLALAAAAGLLWASGLVEVAAWRLLGLQRELQTLLGGQVAALRAGEPGALVALTGFCAAYGFLHAVGPGHGKLLVGGAAVGTGATARRMAAIALAGSLGQALTAVVLIYGGLALLGATARASVEAAEAWATPVGQAAVAAIGLWLALRGVRAWRAASPARAHAPAPAHAHAHSHAHAHAHDHAHDHACGCGHAHAPDPEAVARAQGLGATLGLVAAMAARPCTGAMMLLAVAWSMGVPAAGLAGVFAMGLGAAAFTALVAVLAVTGRDLALLSAGPRGRARRLAPALQIAAGLLLAAAGGLTAAAALAG